MEKYFFKKPEQIKVSLTNVCNYRCIMCYNPSMKQKKGCMDEHLFRKIVDECREEKIEKLSLGSTGEALLHKQYVQFLRYAKSAKLVTSTTSNCSVLSQDISNAIIDENLLDRFNISIYSSNPIEHKKYTGLGNFEQVYENVCYFLDKWYKSGSSTEVNMWFLQLPGVNDYDSYIKLWGPIAQKYNLTLPLKDPINWGGTSGVPETSSKKFQIVTKNDIRYLSWRKKIRCQHVKYYMYILHDGTIVPCCNIPDPEGLDKLVLGNANRESIMFAWHNDISKKLKNDLYRYRVRDYKPCSRCSDVYTNKQIELSLSNIPQRITSVLRNWKKL